MWLPLEVRHTGYGVISEVAPRRGRVWGLMLQSPPGERLRLPPKVQSGCSSMAELKLPKLKTRVRFPSPAPYNRRLIWTQRSSIAMSPLRLGSLDVRFNGSRLIKLSRGCRHVLRRQQQQESGGRFGSATAGFFLLVLLGIHAPSC